MFKRLIAHGTVVFSFVLVLAISGCSTGKDGDVSLKSQPSESALNPSSESLKNQSSKSSDTLQSNDKVQPPRPPYKYLSKGCFNITEVKKFVNKTDPDEFNEGQYKTMIEAVQKDGFLLEPYYSGKSVLSYPRLIAKGKNTITLIFEKYNEGVGLGFYFETNDGVQFWISLYYLDEESAKDARENPLRYSLGNKDTRLSLEKALKLGWKSKVMRIAEKEVISFYQPFGVDQLHPYLEEMAFLYDERYLVHVIVSNKKKDIGVLDFANKLSFVKTPLEG